MQGFSRKYYPQGWRFPQKTGGLTLHSRPIPELPLRPERKWQPDALPERRENGGKRKWRQIGQENFKREIRKKGIMPKRKGTLPEAWNRANHRQGSMILYVWPSVSGLTDKIILPGLPAVYDGLFHLRIGRSCAAFRLRLKGTAKKKNRQKPVKAPLWHKRKRNGPCIISLNFCLGVRQSPFLRLCGSRHTFVQNLFGRWCADGQNRFYGKTYMWG